MITLVGVLFLQWPPGNVYLLFWIENAVVGVVTLPKILTARADRSLTTATLGKPVGSIVAAIFFTFHYGMFCLVHLVFTVLVALAIGVQLTPPFLVLPVFAIFIRYSVELATTWFGDRGQRWTMTTQEAASQPYPRIIVLHLAVMASFGWIIWRASQGATPTDPSDPIGSPLPGLAHGESVLLVVVLLVIKTVVDVVTTHRAIRRR
jgi:Family of unknown function (DUF6498)